MRIRSGAAVLALLFIVACGEGGGGPTGVPGEPPPTGPPAPPPDASCTPLTCAEVGAECGTAFELRCGETVACGECSGTETCSAIGAVCTLPIPTRTSAWEWRAPGQLGGLAGDPLTGDAHVLWHSSAEDAVALERVRDGASAPLHRYAVAGDTRSLFRDTPNLHLEEDGTLYAGVTAWVGFGSRTSVDLGAGPRTGVQVVQLDRHGEYLRTVIACCEFFEVTQWIEDVDPRGNLLVSQASSTTSWKKLVRTDGAEILLWEESVLRDRDGLLAERGCRAPRFTPDGAIVCGGAGPSVTKVDLEGNILWSTALGAGESGAVKDIGVTSRGTIVLAGSSTGRFVADRSGFYAAVEPDGAVRFLRDVEPAPQALAVHPSGRAAMLLAPDFRLEGGADVLYGDLDGELLWRTSVEGAKRIAFAGDEVVVAAETAGTAAAKGTGSSPEISVVGFEPDEGLGRLPDPSHGARW